MQQQELKRYTSIPALIYLLRNKALTLLDPKSWDDTNDSYCLSLYKEKKKLTTLVALCFSETAETYHHWHVFAGDTSGACITFDRQKLLEGLTPDRGFRYGSVKYFSLDDMRRDPPKLSMLPFAKRVGYQHESEFRLLYEHKTRLQKPKNVPLSIGCIRKITLNPWMPAPLVSTMRQTISSIEGCQHLNKYVFRSTLTGNREWKALAKGAA